ncbi:mitochondrial import receptor subunit TOM70 [Microplitis demolitor]|uniref:mitochondrial import receptor subunit TOM70 n=1 Tax=Microplitis demolitor TaxID=69319 RepID=UPI00043FFD8B|nr:mitochondrial import receptor subunit TOM70 [Microplitis demolitor]
MPVASSATSSISGWLPKWQLALAVGAPVALGLGYIYYKNTSQEKSKGGKSNGVGTEKQISIDGDTLTKSSQKPETPTAKAQRFKTLGNQAFGAGKYDEAISFYNKAIETCPTDQNVELAKNYQNRAAAHDALENYSSVKDDCTKALELNPTYTKALLRRARVMEKTNELELALEDVTAACILERFMSQSTLLMADRVLKELGKQHAHEHMKKRKLVMPSKHFIKTYFSSFKNDPIFSGDSDDNDNTALAEVIQMFKDEKYDEIIDACTNKIESSGPEDTQVKLKLHLLRGTFYLLLGQHEDAIEDLNAVINSEESPKNVKVNALIKRATMNMQLENPDKCFADFKTAIEIDSECGDVYHHRGQVNLLLDKVDEAKEDSEKALKLNPNSGIAFAQKCYMDYRHAATTRSPTLVDIAIKEFERAFDLFPDCCECYTLYAQMLCDSQSYDKADEYFAKAIDKDPSNATIRVHRGLLQLQWTGNVEKAVEYINKALELDQKCEFGYETLGTIQVQRGNLKEAIELFDKALELARTALELTHIFSLQDAAKAQLKVGQRLGANSLFGIGNVMS